MIANWWSLNQFQRSKLGNNLRETMLIFKGKFLSAVWMTCVASVLWSLWLRRNNLVFNSHLELLKTTTDLIKFRSFKWLKSEFSFHSELFSIWQVNPAGAALLHRKNGVMQDMVWWNAEFLALTDGAWKTHNNICSAGIGGCIMDRGENLLYIFSGPSKAMSPRESEQEAIIFVFKAFTNQKSIQGRLQIKTDCISLVEDFQKRRAGVLLPKVSNDWAELIANPNIKLIYTSRDNLISAHDLAAQGMQRNTILHAWC